MLAAVDLELRTGIDVFFLGKPEEFKQMLYYQMGWEGDRLPGAIAGKRLRPLLTLAACHALGGDWHKALPAAAAVELVHNFSLVHDDIQDHSETRRGKPTIWVKWGEAQAINTGDALLAIAFLEIQRLELGEKIILQALIQLNKATLTLTSGQYLDLAFEKADTIPFSAYWEMVKGKTGALFGACFALAAIAAGKPDKEIERFVTFGNQFGEAFQVQDDYLGIFGVDIQTGKSAASDLMERKKTYPILYSLEHLPEFRRYWMENHTFSSEDVVFMRDMLDMNGIADVTSNKARELFADLTREYQQLFDQIENVRLLNDIIDNLFDRKR